MRGTQQSPVRQSIGWLYFKRSAHSNYARHTLEYTGPKEKTANGRRSHTTPDGQASSMADGPSKRLQNETHNIVSIERSRFSCIKIPLLPNHRERVRAPPLHALRGSRAGQPRHRDSDIWCAIVAPTPSRSSAPSEISRRISYRPERSSSSRTAPCCATLRSPCSRCWQRCRVRGAAEYYPDAARSGAFAPFLMHERLES